MAITGVTREQFAVILGHLAAENDPYPVTSSVLRYCLETLKKGEPSWWKGVEKAFSKRIFASWQDPWDVFRTAIHFEALNDEKNPLIPYFPSCGGTAEADPSKPLELFLSKPPETFFDNLEKGHPRNYYFIFSNLWITPAYHFFARRGLPYYLVQLDACGGLDLVADFATSVGERYHAPDLVAARIGLDPSPLLVEDIAHRRWMTAGIKPEEMAMIESLDKSIECLLSFKREDSNFVQLVECPKASYLDFVNANVPAGDPDVGLLLYTAFHSNRMNEADYGKLKEKVAALLAPWEDRGLWLEVEPVRGEMYSSTVQLTAHRMNSGMMLEQALYRFDQISLTSSLRFENSAEFLATRPPSKKKA